MAPKRATPAESRAFYHVPCGHRWILRKKTPPVSCPKCKRKLNWKWDLRTGRLEEMVPAPGYHWTEAIGVGPIQIPVERHPRSRGSSG